MLSWWLSNLSPAIKWHKGTFKWNISIFISLILQQFKVDNFKWSLGYWLRIHSYTLDQLTMQIMTSGGTFSFRELLLPSEDISETRLFFLLLLIRRCFNWGFGFLGVSSSKEMTKPLEASASSLSFSIFMAASASASSSVRPWPDNDRSDDGPAESPPEPFLCCLNVDEMVGL